MDQPQTEKSKKKLTTKQKVFAVEYARTCNGAEAARRAGVDNKRAKKSAWKWLNDPAYDHVAEYVDELLADASSQRKIDHDLLRQFLRGRLELDTRDFFYPAKDEKGNPHPQAGKPKNPSDLDWTQAQYLQGFSNSEYSNESANGATQSGSSSTVKFTCANKAADMLCKSSGFYLKDLGPSEADEQYRQADSELDGLLEELDDQDDADEEESPEEEAAGEGSAS